MASVGVERQYNWRTSRTIRNIFNDFSFTVTKLNRLTICKKEDCLGKQSYVANESEVVVIETHQ